MGQRSDEIERYIEQKQQELGENLRELDERVKRTFNWQAQVDRHPLSCMAVACASGIILSSVVGGGARRTARSFKTTMRESEVSAERYKRAGLHNSKAQAWAVWENIKDAVVGVMASKVVNFMDRAVPGFRSEFAKAEQKRPAWSYGSGEPYQTEPDFEHAKAH